MYIPLVTLQNFINYNGTYNGIYPKFHFYIYPKNYFVQQFNSLYNFFKAFFSILDT